VRGSEGLIAFCGSYDPEHTREGGNEKYGDPWHEVTLRVKGPAAYRLLQVFLERWTDATENTDFRTAIGRSDGKERSELTGGIPAQVTVTTGDLKDNKSARWDPVTGTDTKQPYDFAPSGDRSFRAVLARAINTAESDIYLECQFGWGESGAMGETLRTALTNALNRPNMHVTVVTPKQDTVPEFTLADTIGIGLRIGTAGQPTYNPDGSSRRRGGILGVLGVIAGQTGKAVIDHIPDFQRAQDWFWDPVKNHKNFRIFHTHASRKSGEKPQNHFIHSKLWIFDRQFALIGSGNFNNRSLSHDSEVMTGFYDPVNLKPLRDRLERRKRHAQCL
jgi:phosphatidylserine/phosphatidylglycerophosphate/cardiolipin synthase-like enzyme